MWFERPWVLSQMNGRLLLSLRFVSVVNDLSISTSHPFSPRLPSLLSRKESRSRTPSSDFERRTHKAKAGRGTTKFRNIFHVTHSPGSAFRCRANTWNPPLFLRNGCALNWGESCSLEGGFSPKDSRIPPRGTSTIRLRRVLDS